MSSAVEDRYTRLAAHQLTAHKMRGRGAPIDRIADHLRVSTRTVGRYLAAPRPEEPAPKKEVLLGDFFLEGACGSFPEYSWWSRSSLMQKECKAICAHCPVLAKCLEYGLNGGVEDESILGGLTVRERRAEATRRRGAARRARADEDNDAAGAA